MSIFDIFISTIIGMISSYLVWYLIYKVFVPKISFSDKISKKESIDSKSNYNYRIKFENSGYRDILDINIIAKFSIIGLNGKDERNRDVFYLDTSFNRYIPILKPLKTLTNLFKINDENKVLDSHKTLRSIIRVYPNNDKELSRAYYPIDIQNKVKNEELTLEDLYNIGTDAFLEIVVSGIDSFSNSKRIFVKKYLIDDIIKKPFEYGSLSIKY